MTAPLLLALDPSLACTGGLLVTLDGRAELVAAFTVQTFADVARTAPALHRQHDASHRGVDMYRGIVRHAGAHPVALVAYEVPLGAKDAEAAWSLARANQVARLAALAITPDTNPVGVSTFEAKLLATGSKKPRGGKAEVARGVRRAWGPLAWDRVLASVVDPKRREAIYDAGAVALVALRHPAARVVINDHAASGAA